MRRRPAIKWAACGVLFAAGFVWGMAAGRLSDGEAIGALLTIAAITGALAIVPATLAMWAQLDELQREAHKSAWFWGSSVGIGLSLVPLILLSQRAAAAEQEVAAEAIMAGAGVVLGCALLGYLVAWVFFWALKR